MSLLFRNLRVHQVFGANTDVGKTVIVSALVRASAVRGNRVFYLKPVSAGPSQGADDKHISLYAEAWKHLVQSKCLFHFQDPVSPHLAAQLATGNDGGQVLIPTNDVFLNSIRNYVQECASATHEAACMFLETAGGVHSPTPSGMTQVESYRPLFLPTILIGDSKLGGISSTISAFESLLLRGYIVDSILLFRDDLYRNWEYLTQYFAEQGIPVAEIEPPPPQSSDPQENYLITEKYYNTVTGDTAGKLFDILSHLDDRHVRRLEELDSMSRRTLDTIWWPFVQHRLVSSEQDVTVIDSAISDFFSIYNPHRSSSPHSSPRSLLEAQFDGSASWWTQAIGHAHPSLTLAAARAAGRYGHVMFPQATHLPALKLAERLVRDGPGEGWASRAHFSDDGSTGMEVALKMALRAFCARESTDLDTSAKKKLGVLGLKGSYHGDTIGAMDASEEGVFTCEWHSAKGYWFEPPTISIQRGEVLVSLPPAIAAKMQSAASAVKADSLSWVYDVPHRLQTSLATVYRTFIEQTLSNLRKLGEPKLAALVLEPLVMGAGGMIFVDPLFQRVMVDVVRGPTDSPPSQWSGLPVIFDEVFVGLYRLGMQSSIPLLGVTPDISVYAKILTGGLVPLAVTLASDSIFKAFLGENKTDALLHGHSYTAHPVGCEVANEALNLVEGLASGGTWKDAKSMWSQPCHPAHAQVWSFWHPEFVDELSCMNCVAEVMTLGTVLAFKLRGEGTGGYESLSAQTALASIKNSVGRETNISISGELPFSIHFRTLGNVAYFMTSLNTAPKTIRLVESRIRSALQSHQ